MKMWCAGGHGGSITRAVVNRTSWLASHSMLRSANAAPISCPPSFFPSSFTARCQTIRSLSSYNSSSLDAFRDSVDRETRGNQPVGRSWGVQELRRKSYEDLHKLWYVLYKEKNMLLTERQLSRRRQLVFPQPQRLKKVQKSMQAIKQVLGERKRRKIAEHHANKMEESLQDESTDMEDIEVTVEK